MMISQTAAKVLVDLIENKLAVLQIGDRDDLREMITLQRCLSELKGIDVSSPVASGKFSEKDIPLRGRHRKLSALMDDAEVEREMA